MYTIVFQKSPKAYRLVLHAIDDWDILSWLYDTAVNYQHMAYLLIVDSNKHILLKYKRTAR